jgi:hypothetical protein
MSSASGSLGHHRLTLENIPLHEGTPATWGDSVQNWKQYLREKANESMVFVGASGRNQGEIVTAPYSHRFRQEYTEMQYAKIQGFIRGSLSEYEDPHLVFLTFSTSTTTPGGKLRHPLDHMDEVVETWGDGVYYELNQVMDGARKRDPWEPREEWEYLYILEPTTDEGTVPGGYAHAHAALVVDGEVESERFESVINRHLAEAPNAMADAHEFNDAIEVIPADELNNPGAYLFKYLGKSWNTEDMEDYEERFAALLKESERQRFRASNGGQRWMQLDEEESEAGDWDFAGIVENDRLEQLLEYDDALEFCEAHGVRKVSEWITRSESLTTERANRGTVSESEPLASEWTFSGMTGKQIGRYVQEAKERERPDPPPDAVRRTRANSQGAKPPPVRTLRALISSFDVGS